MKRLASQLSIILTALTATPAALAGADILKCVDHAGRVTLTDQPCDGAARVSKLAAATALNTPADSMQGASGGGATGSGGGEEAPASALPAESAPAAVTVQRYAAPPAMERQHDWRPRVPRRDRPLARDVATLKAARAQLMLIDADRQPRPRLATIQ